MRMAEIKHVVQRQPREVVHERRVLFFPEHREKIYFDFIIKRLIPFLTAVWLAIWGIKGVIEAIENL